jgi:CRISPR/Cas system endoribonuclease Cas6 (RAMP superfamily)
MPKKTSPTPNQPVNQQQKAITLEQVLYQISVLHDNLKQICTNVIMQQAQKIQELEKNTNDNKIN